MATLDYIDIPFGATRLRSLSEPQNAKSHSIRPAPKITTSIPKPSPPPSPTSIKRRPSILSSTAASLTSPTLSFIPQLMLSAALPPMTPNPATAPPPTSKIDPNHPSLLSSRDALSLPIMSTNFKRFVAAVGPILWFQDRVEEIVLWKTGPSRTIIWMAAYSFICFFPRILLLMPHIILIGVILATYPYPSNSAEDPIYSPESIPPPQPATEGPVPWQANIQGIQNLMGAISDLHDLVAPHVYHLRLTPQHLSTSPQRNSSATTTSGPRSPYTAHILALLVLSFVPLLFIIHLPLFPIREVCLAVGLLPFFINHPRVRALLPTLFFSFIDMMPLVLIRLVAFKDRTFSKLGLRKSCYGCPAVVEEYDSNAETKKIPLPLSTILQRVIDDDRLSDECWNSEMREVQLWENERFGGPVPTDSPTMIATTMGLPSSSSSVSVTPQKGWNKQNLRPGERSAWTRGRDGWSGVGTGGMGSVVEGSGEVSSNLTFSLAPGWAFVETEDWRKDLQCAWSGCGGDLDGWVYTNDAWLGSRPAPYTSGGGSVTRRRRWVRRVWYDPRRASADS